jgi:hypothetical protein
MMRRPNNMVKATTWLMTATAYRFFRMTTRFNALSGDLNLARDFVIATRGHHLKISSGRAA